MTERIAALAARHEPGLGRLRERGVQLALRASVDDAERIRAATAQAGEASERFLRGRGQAVELPRQQVEDVLGVAFPLYLRQVPCPGARRRVEREAALASEL